MRLPIPAIILSLLAYLLMPGCAQKYAPPPAPISLNAVRLDKSRIKVTIAWESHDPPVILGIHIQSPHDEPPLAQCEVEPNIFPEHQFERLGGIMLIRKINEHPGNETFIIKDEKLKARIGEFETIELRAMWFEDINVIVRESWRIKGSPTLSEDKINPDNAPSELTLVEQTAQDCFESALKVRSQVLREYNYVQFLVHNPLAKDQRIVIPLNEL